MSEPKKKATAKARAEDIDAYLRRVPAEKRALLSALRKTIRAIVPHAEECISYGMPAFRVGGAVVAGFQATSRGGSYYPFSGSTLATLGDAVSAFDGTKSALHFTAESPLPRALVKKLLDARIAEASGKNETKKTKAPPRKAAKLNDHSVKPRKPRGRA